MTDAGYCGRQGGFTLIEALVAATLLVLGVGAAVGAFAVSARHTQTGGREAQVAAIAEREMEALASRPFDKLKLKPDGLNGASHGTGLPDGAPDPDNPANPDYYLVAGGDCGKYQLKVMPDYHDDANDAKSFMEDVIAPPCGNANGAVQHTSDFGSSCTSKSKSCITAPPGLSGTVYRYVTTVDDQCAPGLPLDLSDSLGNLLDQILGALLHAVNAILQSATSPLGIQKEVEAFCAGQTDERRITIAAVLDRAPNETSPPRPIWMSTIVAPRDQGVIYDIPDQGL